MIPVSDTPCVVTDYDKDITIRFLGSVVNSIDSGPVVANYYPGVADVGINAFVSLLFRIAFVDGDY